MSGSVVVLRFHLVFSRRWRSSTATYTTVGDDSRWSCSVFMGWAMRCLAISHGVESARGREWRSALSHDRGPRCGRRSGRGSEGAAAVRGGEAGGELGARRFWAQRVQWAGRFARGEEKKHLFGKNIPQLAIFIDLHPLPHLQSLTSESSMIGTMDPILMRKIFNYFQSL